jgi:hypothetical protein
LALLKNVGSDAYLLSFALIVITGMFVGLMVRKRFARGRNAKRLSDIAKLAGARPVPVA